MKNKVGGNAPIEVTTPQRLFIRYLMATLIDLTVLNLFAEYWQLVVVDSFTVSILAASLLQTLLRGTLAVERRAAAYFDSKAGRGGKILRPFSAWLILFGSKFVMLGAIDLVFGRSVEFTGPLQGVVAFVVVVVTMVVAERVTARIFWKLGDMA